MNGKQLKNSILQLAILGKLVPQDPNDEPASVLLEKIRKEKEYLVKTKKIVLSKPEKGVKKNPISEYTIPKNWETCQLVDICRAFGRIGFRGYTKNDLVTGPEFGAISLSPSNMKEYGMEYVDCTFITWEKYEESPEIKIENGDILIVKTGSSYGKTVLVKNLPHKATINPQIAVIKDIKIDTEYLELFLQSPSARIKYEEFVLGTSIPTFSQLNLLSIEIPIPPLAEQKRIVTKVKELMPLVEEYDKAQTKLDVLNAKLPEALKKSILQEAIQGKLVPQDPHDEPASVLLQRIRKEKEQLVKDGKLKKKDLAVTPVSDEEKPFDIPEGWEWCRLGDIYNIYSAMRIHQTDWKTRGIPFFRGRELVQLIKTGSVTPEIFISEELYKEKSEKSRLPQKDDILITAVGSIGQTYIVNGTNRFYYKDAYILCLQDFGVLYSKYIKMVLDSPQLQQEIHHDSLKTTVAQLTIIKANNLMIPIPPLFEQKRIVAKIEELFGMLK